MRRGKTFSIWEIWKDLNEMLGQQNRLKSRKKRTLFSFADNWIFLSNFTLHVSLAAFFQGSVTPCSSFLRMFVASHIFTFISELCAFFLILFCLFLLLMSCSDMDRAENMENCFHKRKRRKIRNGNHMSSEGVHDKTVWKARLARTHWWYYQSSLSSAPPHLLT